MECGPSALDCTGICWGLPQGDLDIYPTLLGYKLVMIRSHLGEGPSAICVHKKDGEKGRVQRKKLLSRDHSQVKSVHATRGSALHSAHVPDHVRVSGCVLVCRVWAVGVGTAMGAALTTFNMLNYIWEYGTPQEYGTLLRIQKALTSLIQFNDSIQYIYCIYIEYKMMKGTVWIDKMHDNSDNSTEEEIHFVQAEKRTKCIKQLLCTVSCRHSPI